MSTILTEGELTASVETSEKPQGKGLIALPALASAEDHARAVKPLALGAAELPLELWLAAITGAPRVDPYLLAALAFGRSALGGAGTIMAHYIRPQGGMTLVEEAREVARAAQDVGVRIAFTLVMRDRNAIAYGNDDATLQLFPESERKLIRERLAPPPVSPQAQVALIEE